MDTFSREARCPDCGSRYLISGTSISPGVETEATKRFCCECGGWIEAFIPGSVSRDKLVVTRKP